jgi:hypothetical protein
MDGILDVERVMKLRVWRDDYGMKLFRVMGHQKLS